MLEHPALPQPTQGGRSRQTETRIKGLKQTAFSGARVRCSQQFCIPEKDLSEIPVWLPHDQERQRQTAEGFHVYSSRLLKQLSFAKKWLDCVEPKPHPGSGWLPTALTDHSSLALSLWTLLSLIRALENYKALPILCKPKNSIPRTANKIYFKSNRVKS